MDLSITSVEMNGTNIIVQHIHLIPTLTVNGPFCESLPDDVLQERIVVVGVIVVIVATIL